MLFLQVLDAVKNGVRVHALLKVIERCAMLLMPSTPNIDLYKEGFDPAKDLLGRAETGKKLSALVERFSDPMVIALDGDWGSGKSFFLQCWVGAHKLQNKGTAKTVYFDAFEHDFMNEPLASLMGVLAERFEDQNPDTKTAKAIGVLKRAALQLTRVALAVASSGATEAGGALMDAVTKGTEKELANAADDFWKRETGKRAAMKQFSNALADLTGPEESPADTEQPEGETVKPEPQKLVIVIDELDRCRPDYALTLLEIIKHFFAVPNVHFVLGVNLHELENSVKARYGAEINAGLYLQKFVTLSMELPKTSADQRNSLHAIHYFERAAQSIGMTSNTRLRCKKLLELLRPERALSLRSVERMLPVIQLTLVPTDRTDETVVLTLAVIKTLSPSTYAKAKAGTLNMLDLGSFFNIPENPNKSDHSDAAEFFVFWEMYLDLENYKNRTGINGPSIPQNQAIAQKQLRGLIDENIEAFSLEA